MIKKKFALICILLVGNIFFGFQYFSSAGELKETKVSLGTQKTNDKVLEFTKLFINKVLKAKDEVSFETRLKLENSVRELNDSQILESWTNFIEAKTESEAQESVKVLLELLISKVKVS